MRDTRQPTFQEFSNKIKGLVGRDYDRVNCWDLCREFYLAVFNVHLKHYYKEPPANKRETRFLIYTNMGDFYETKEPKFGDLIVFKIHGIESHIGIYLDQSTFLHSSKTTGSVIDRMDKWKNLVVGYYRHGRPQEK